MTMSIKIDKDEAAENLDAHRLERERAAVESRHPFGVAGPDQRTVKIVGPGMIGADDCRFFLSCPKQQFVTTVLAYVVKRVQRTRSITDHEDILLMNPGSQVVARFSHLARSTDPTTTAPAP